MQIFTESDITSYLVLHFDRVWPRIVEHLLLCGMSLLIALVISLPTGLLLSRVGRLSTPVLLVLNIIYTIPSLALFAFLLLLPDMSIGTQPAVIALTAYALSVLVRNTMVAFNGVDPSVKEAARGMGMSGMQMLWRVETPLALPVIIAGMRIATLSTIGLATIAAWIGAGGLGQILREGINDPSKLYAGVISVAVMALAADLIFRAIERRLVMPISHRATAQVETGPELLEVRSV
jgi:osmoprotectant transport system permease protein